MRRHFALWHWTRQTSEKIASAFGALFVFLSVCWSYGLSPSTLHSPIEWWGDSLLTMTGLQNMETGRWYFSTPNLRFPTSQHLQDFPAVLDGLHLLTARLLTLAP